MSYEIAKSHSQQESGNEEEEEEEEDDDDDDDDTSLVHGGVDCSLSSERLSERLL